MNNIDRSAWAQFRMPTWEDDISLNHSSQAPFENLPAPCEMDASEFKPGARLTEELLAGKSIMDFVVKDTYPIPAVEDREGYNKNYNAHFFLNGLADYLKVNQAVERHNIKMESYFDFGCASGRILRHFCAQSDIKKLWGSDINGPHIKWLNDHLPSQLKIIHNNCIPNLQIADNSVDVISAFSVFTHIDTFETAWLAELHRILSPGGMVYLTVQNNSTWNLLRDGDDTDALLSRVREISPDADELLKSELAEGRLDFRYTDVGAYRSLVFHSDNYLKKTWGRFFEILEIIPVWHGYYQSVFIGRKKP
jgi:SAM-dependent methyltransferase